MLISNLSSSNQPRRVPAHLMDTTCAVGCSAMRTGPSHGPIVSHDIPARPHARGCAAGKTLPSSRGALSAAISPGDKGRGGAAAAYVLYSAAMPWARDPQKAGDWGGSGAARAGQEFQSVSSKIKVSLFTSGPASEVPRLHSTRPSRSSHAPFARQRLEPAASRSQRAH